MKKLTLAFLACFSAAACVFAQEAEPSAAAPYKRIETRTVEKVPFAFSGGETIDIVGLRLGAWGKCHDITGLDLSIGGTEAQNAYGLQVALIRNKVHDRAGAAQITLGANSAAELSGVQIGLLWNDALIMRGLQAGLVNIAGDVRGFQIGLLNTTEVIYGYQIGLINVIKGSKVPFFPIINFQFAED